MADTLKPWLHKTTNDYLNRHKFNLSFDIETSRLLQITEFHVEEASDQQIWAKGHDKEIAVLIHLDQAAVADFNSSHVQPVTGYRGGLFRILKVALCCSIDYPDAFRPAQSGSAKAEKLFLHVKAFEYYSSKGEASFARSCRDLTDSFGSWIKRYRKHRAKRNIDIADDPALDNEDVSMDLPPSMSQFTTDAGLAKLRNGTAGLAEASVQARSVKTPPPPSPAIRSTPKSRRTNRAIISELLRDATVTPKPGSASKAATTEVVSEEQVEVSNEIVTFDTSSAMPSTPEPPPTSTATTSAAASPAGRPETLGQADPSLPEFRQQQEAATVVVSKEVDNDATIAIDAEEVQRQQSPAGDIPGFVSVGESASAEDASIGDILDAEEVIRNASMETQTHKPKKRIQLPRYELSSQASDPEPNLEALAQPEAGRSSPQQQQQTQTVNDNTASDFVSVLETQTVERMGQEEARAVAEQDMPSARDTILSPTRTAQAIPVETPVLPEPNGGTGSPALIASDFAASSYHPEERQILAGQSSQDAVEAFVTNFHGAPIWNDRSDDSFDFVSFAQEQHGDQQEVQAADMLPKAESVVPENPLDFSARAEGRLANLRRSVSHVSQELNEFLQEETQRLFPRGYVGTASPFSEQERDAIANLARHLLLSESDSEEEREVYAHHALDVAKERAIPDTPNMNDNPGASGAATAHREDSLLFETSYTRQELDDLMHMDDNPNQQSEYAAEGGQDQHRDSSEQTGTHREEQPPDVDAEAVFAVSKSTSLHGEPPESNRSSLRMSAFALLAAEAESSPASQREPARTASIEQTAKAITTAKSRDTAPGLATMLSPGFGLSHTGTSSKPALPDDNTLQTTSGQLPKPISPRQPSIARSEVQAEQVVPLASPEYLPPRTAAPKRKRSPQSSNIDVTSTAKKAKTEVTKARQEELKAEVAKGVRHRLMKVAPGLSAAEGLGLWYCCSGDWIAAATIARFNKKQADSDDDRDPSVLPEQVVNAFKSCWTPEDDKVALRKDTHRKSAQLAREAIERRRGPDSIAKRKNFLKQNYVAAQMRHAQPVRYPYNTS